MNDKELRSNGPPTHFDDTILKTQCVCHRALYWFLRGLDYKTVPVYFVTGRAFGAAVNVWHSRNGEPLFSNKETGEGRFVDSLAAAQAIWQKECPVETDKENWETFVSLFKEYVSFYGLKERWNMAYKSGEKGFALPLPGAPAGVVYCGAIDAPILWKPYGNLVREDKTTGAWVTQGYLDQWDYSTQVTGYIWAFVTVNGDCFGAYMNIAGKIPRYEKTGKNKIPAPHLRFARYLTKREPDDLVRFMKESCSLVEGIWREWDPGAWNWDKTGKRNPMSCTGGMGRSPCLYRHLCLLPVEPWEMEEHNYLDEFSWRGRWAPWERDGTDE